MPLEEPAVKAYQGVANIIAEEEVEENGTPFFWLGETGWLLPECLNREEAAYYLENCKQAGYNVVQIQTMNQVPSINIYGQYSLPDGFNFKNIDKKGVY